MTEPTALSPFEQRVATELGRLVAGASDPMPAAEIAGRAMRPAGLRGRARSAARSRRLLLFGLAAALLLPAAAVGALVLRQPAQVEPAIAEDQAILVRRTEGSEPGVAILAVRPDGAELLLREVPDSILPDGSSLGIWGSVSRTGWLALGAERQGGPWPMVLVDLADPSAGPWVVNEANLGGIGASWGPTGLVAAEGSSQQSLVVVDPDAHAIRHVSMQGLGLVGGGPSIIWTADGRGFAGQAEDGSYKVVPLDGGQVRSSAMGVFDPRGWFGSGLAVLNTCFAGAGCPGGDDGRIERVEPDGSSTTVWRPNGGDRALGAAFAMDDDGLWLTLDHDQGRQVLLARVRSGRQETVATIARGSGWQYVGLGGEAPDHASLVVWLDLGGSTAAVMVPMGGAPQTFHPGQFAGYVPASALEGVAGGSYEAPAETMPVVGEAYALPSLDSLIAAELERNPGRAVLGSASQEGVPGDSEVRTVEVSRAGIGGPAGEVYLDCLGPSPVTVRSGEGTVTSPCLTPGSHIGAAFGTVTVESSGETTWRVVIYSP